MERLKLLQSEIDTLTLELRGIEEDRLKLAEDIGRIKHQLKMANLTESKHGLPRDIDWIRSAKYVVLQKEKTLRLLGNNRNEILQAISKKTKELNRLKHEDNEKENIRKNIEFRDTFIRTARTMLDAATFEKIAIAAAAISGKT